MAWLALTLEVDAEAAEAMSEALLEAGARSVSIDGVDRPRQTLNALLDVHCNPGDVVGEKRVDSREPHSRGSLKN